jgi:predicted ATP-binding protein involved in virulence
MKLNKIKINKLFGSFNHEVRLNNESRITIIIGENGLGKTVLLEMIEAFFKSNYFYFNEIDFESMTFEFDDSISWILIKENSRANFPMLKLTQINKNKSQYKPVILNCIPQRNIDIFNIRNSREASNFRRLGSNIWEDVRTGELIRNDDMHYNYRDYMHNDIYNASDELPKWYSDRHEKIIISLIETQRLILLTEREDRTSRKTVEKYSNELTRTIKTFLTESTELSSKLDRTYPNRLVERLEKSSNVTNEVLNNELIRLEKKRKLLDAVGLIEIEKDSNILEIQNPQDVIRDVLMLYVEDSFKKIEIFDNIATKIEIFLDIINRRFKHKTLFIDKENGFLFKSNFVLDERGNKQIIPVNKLSSGEQNELVLFYLLLFKTDENSLILIDEPEVSLHISWQNCFIEDLKQITKLNNLDVIIATHSPDIIANNWNLKVELKGLE